MLEEFRKNWLSKPRLVCGIMTGTSLDGVDIAICSIEKKGDEFGIELVAKKMFSFPASVEFVFDGFFDGFIIIKDIAFENTNLSYIFADYIKQLCEKNNIDQSDIETIGFHGQTIWHSPCKRKIDFLNNTKFSYQLGCGSTLATLTGIPVVNNFRAADMALGGQGAPLAPIFDYHFLRSSTDDVIALNIGGIANITYMPKSCKKEDVIAFDTGPGNILIDDIIQEFYGRQYDRNGDIARSGNLIPELFQGLKGKDTYITKKPPKSTGREYYNVKFINSMIGNDDNSKNYQDRLNTFTRFTAWSIAKNIKMFANPKAKIIVTGGGRKNKYMMELLRDYLPDAKIITKDNRKMPADIKEAMIFAFLAYLNLGGIPGNMPSVTGAESEIILGSLSIPT
jgi:anhydro-N-acetylmuramic acid kinase